MKLSDVGYAYVPGPLSSPSGSVTSSTVVPVMNSPITVRRAYPVALPRVAATVTTDVPNGAGTVAENAPAWSASTVTTLVAPPVSVAVDWTSTVAPGVVVPVTVTVGVVTVVPSAGAVTVTGSVPGGPDRTYRSATIAGCSSGRPAPSARISRACWACAQVSGEDEPAGLPLTKPIDAVVGSVPNGDAARSGFSQDCSGIIPTPEVESFIAASRAVAPARSPVCSCCSARSPDSTGQ